MRTGIGHARHADGFLAGKSVVESALRSGDISRPDLVIAFCSGELDHDAFFEGIQQSVGTGVPVIGGSTIGVITNDYLSYRGTPSAAAIMQADECGFSVAASGGLDKGETPVGTDLARRLLRSERDKVLLAFYDSVRKPATATSPPVLNASAPFLEGLGRELTEAVPIVGAGLIGDYAFGATRQFCGDRVGEQHAVGCMVSGPLSIYHVIMHGCVPLDGIYRRITGIDGSVLYELDGKPVVPLIDALFGSSDWQSDHPVNYLTLGVNYGERYGDPQEDSYVNRLITGITGDGTGIGMFEPDLAAGMEIQFMIRDNDTMLRSAKNNTTAILAGISAAGKVPKFALYIDCAGRTAEYSLTEQEEASEVRNILDSAGVPLLGFYSGVEIAPLLNHSRGLDWTGVLLVLAEDK
jgi:hypothetical protein